MPRIVIDAADQSVVWTNLVNVTASGNVLQKTSGCDGCDDAGATSQQELSAGDWYVEFTVGEPGTLWLAGLSHGNDGTSYTDIDFAFFFNGAGYAEIRENGVYQADTIYTAGDVFRVGVVGGRVQYFKNGTRLRESANAPQYPLLLDTSLLTVGATIRSAVIGVTDPPPNGARGAFTFPEPYNTTGVRLTNASDCASSQDCFWYVGYSYWRHINNHVGSSDMYIFLGMDRARGGGGPTLLRYIKATDDVQNLGPLFSPDTRHSYSTGEGWYFSATHPTRLYTFLVGSSQLWRYDVIARQFEAAPVMDLANCQRPQICPPNAAYIIQPHSSDDDLVHSATVQDSNWQRIGCVVRHSVSGRYAYIRTPAGYRLDECHVDKSGGWLLLTETSADGMRRNRIVDLAKGHVTSIDAVEGALGHLDMGHGYAVGADTFNPLENATILLKFPVTSTTRPIGPVVHYNKRWDMAAANHVAHGNGAARAPEAQYACGSNASRLADMADEIICFPLDAYRNADGSLDVLVVGQVMTDLDAPGGQDLDVTITSSCRRAIWTSPAATSSGPRTWEVTGLTHSS